MNRNAAAFVVAIACFFAAVFGAVFGFRNESGFWPREETDAYVVGALTALGGGLLFVGLARQRIIATGVMYCVLAFSIGFAYKTWEVKQVMGFRPTR